jgi:hypothetical protein
MLVDIRINANSVASKAVHIRGWQEGCKMRGVTASSATTVCFQFDAVDDAAGGNGVIQNTVFEDLRAIPLSGTIGFRLRDFRRNDCRRWTVDSVTEDPPAPVLCGIELQEDCYLNTFAVLNIEDCTIGIDINTDPATGANDCDGNNFLAVSVSSSSATPGDTTIGADTGMMAVVVRSGCKYYNFLSLRQHYAYDWLLYDAEKGQKIVGDGNGGGDVTWRGFVLSAGDVGFVTDDRQVFAGATIDAWTPNADAITADTTDFDVSDTNNMQCDTTDNDITVHGVSGGVRGQRLALIKDVVTNTLTIKHNSGTGDEVFLTPDGRDIIMPANERGAVDAIFNGTSWRVEGFHRVEGNGTATVASGNTTVVVTHGLGVTPDLQDISVTPTNNLGNATKFWLSTPTSTQFTINVDVDPGATTATFVWTASIQ